MGEGFDPDDYDQNEDGILTKTGIRNAVEDNPPNAWMPSVIDGARYLYKDNQTRGKFYELYNEFKGSDDPNVPDAPNWKTDVQAHEIDLTKYGHETEDDEEGKLPEIPEPEEEVTWGEVRAAVLQYFDSATYEAVEALATVPIQLMFPEFTDCPMVILTGSASSGKTTVLELFKGWDRLVVTHEVTPAAFVSHNADQNDENLGELDLLPKIANQVLWVPEMGTWFTGDNVEEYMRTLAGVADGSGYVKSTGAQGTHGYDGEPGEYQFGMMGATTPPSPTAWAEMGNAGARLLFHRMPNTEDDDEVLDQVYGNGNVSYPEKKRIVQEKIRDWLRTLWHEHDGEIEMETEEKDSDVAFATLKLAEIIALSRGVSYATMNDSGQLEGETQVEDRKRALQMLRYTARARAAMDGRKKVTTDDLQLCARIAFATIPERRRGIIRHMCNPYNGSKFTTAEVKNALDLGSKNTAKKRMQMIDNLGIATYESEGESTRGGQTDVIRLTSDQEELMWLFSAENDESDTGPLRWPFDG